MKNLLHSSATRVLAFALLFSPTYLAAQHQVVVGDPTVNGGLSFVDGTTHISNTVVYTGDTVQWVWGADTMPHSTTSGTCIGAVCQSTPYWNSGEFTTPHTFNRFVGNPGLFPYFCTVHDSRMVGMLRVLPTPTPFALQTPPTSVGTQPSAVAVGDFNNDGKLDLAVANQGGNTVTILLGNGSGMFTPASGSPITGFSGPVSIAVGFFHNISNLDLVVANSGNHSVSILLGNGDGTFTAGPSINLPVNQTPLAVVTADFDGDLKTDLAVATNPSSNPTQNNVNILLGNGDGTFQAPATISTGGSFPGSLVVFDFNNDGKPDLAAANAMSNNISVLLNTTITPGMVSFGTATIISTGNSPHGIAAGAFNDSQGNLTPGIGVANQTDDTVSVFLRNSMGNFAPATGSPFAVGSGNAPGAIVVGDFNGDGALDLAVANTATGKSSVTSLMNDGAGSFTSFITTNSEPLSSPVAIVAGDFNGDGKPDLAVAGFARNHVSVLLNILTPFPPPPPQPATHFGITVQGAGPPTPEGNPSTTAGVSFQIIVTAYDPYQRIATGYIGRVHFTTSDPHPMVVLPADYTFTSGVGMDNGVHVFNVTLKTADFQTIEVHDTNPAVNGGRSSDILVTPAATAKFAVVAPAMIPAGNTFNFSVTAKDSFDNLTPAYAGTVQFSSSDPDTVCKVLPAPSMLTSGFGNFSAKLITVGSQTVVATDSVTSSITGMTSISVQSGSLHFAVVPSVTTVNAGTPISITVSARDICENLQTGYTGTVHFTSTDPAATLPTPDYTFTVGAGGDNGSHTFTNGVIFHTNGDRTVTGSDQFNQFFGTSRVIHVLGLTTVSLALVTRPFLLRHPLTLTATVQVTPPSTGTPTGTVTFFDGGAPLATSNLNDNQQATYTSSNWAYSRHIFTAVYNGDANFNSSTSPPVVKSPRPH